MEGQNKDGVWKNAERLVEFIWFAFCFHFARRGRDTLGSRGYFFLIDISRRSRVNEAQSAEEKKITSGHRGMQPHFHARNQFRN